MSRNISTIWALAGDCDPTRVSLRCVPLQPVERLCRIDFESLHDHALGLSDDVARRNSQLELFILVYAATMEPDLELVMVSVHDLGEGVGPGELIEICADVRDLDLPTLKVEFTSGTPRRLSETAG